MIEEDGYYYVHLSAMSYVTTSFVIAISTKNSSYYSKSDIVTGDGGEVSKTLIINKVIKLSEGDYIIPSINTYTSTNVRNIYFNVFKL